ncbi:MAG: hypothetical protein IKT35_03145, partial [Clostridia bacterium]|nr:hypothetical protein [Clostridia bacterium]
MKKILAVILCLMLVATSSVIAFAEPAVDATITVATVEGPFAAGDEVAIPITVTEWANAYGGFKLEVLYDDTVLKFDYMEKSSTDFGGSLCTTNGNKLSLVASPSSDRQAEKVDGGEICVVYFVAAKDITESTVVTVNATVLGYTYGEEDGWLASHALTTDIVSGGVHVGETEPSNPEESNPTQSGEATITVATVKGDFSAGEEIALPITISEWAKGYASMYMEVGYDNAVLELSGIEASETDFNSAMISTNGEKIGVIANPLSVEQANNVSGGEICVVYFVALTDIAENTVVTVTAEISAYSYGEEDNWTVDEDLNVTVIAGGIEYEEAYVCKHTGATEIRDSVEENCANDGYTGDTYCKECGEMIAEGSVIPATGNHIGGEATCVAKAVCDVCAKEYGEVDANNHKNTAVINVKVEDCGNDGYTGDTYCNDCHKVIAEGNVIPATGAHVGGEATCVAKAVCDVCAKEYGEVDANNHSGETVILNATDKYTGDICCADCEQIFTNGQKYGDVNGDGEIAAEDALLALQHSVDKIQLTGISVVSADVDDNGIVDASDALLILQYSVDKISQFPR